MNNLIVKKIAPSLNFGVQVEGLSRRDLQREELRKQLYDLWIQEGLIVFRECAVDTDFQIELSRCFGPLEPHNQPEIWVNGNPELIQIKYAPNRGTIYEVDGVPQASWVPWHSDLVYMSRINHGGILRAIKIASRGGMTGFIDRIYSYERLPDELKARIEDLRVIYRMRIDIGRNRFATKSSFKRLRSSPHIDSVEEREDRDFPPVTHPLVYRQPETGRKVLNLSPLFAVGILGMEASESDALLTRLVEHMTNEAQAYHHAWQPTDLVLWDNWRIVHSVTGSPIDEEREMQRTTIAGDYRLGEMLAGHAS